MNNKNTMAEGNRKKIAAPAEYLVVTCRIFALIVCQSLLPYYAKSKI